MEKNTSLPFGSFNSLALFTGLCLGAVSYTHLDVYKRQTSPRAVNDAQAKAVIASAPLQYVGVFRNAPLDEVVARAQALELAAVQLHGDEDQA